MQRSAPVLSGGEKVGVGQPVAKMIAMLIPDHAHIVRIGVEHAFIFFAAQDISTATVAKKHCRGGSSNDAAFRTFASPLSPSCKKIDH